MQPERGFSFVELVVALAIVLAVTASAFALMAPSSGLAMSREETSDMQQRLRVAADVVHERLAAAGAGGYADGATTPLYYSRAAVLPYRGGGTAPDAPGSFKTDTITIFEVPRVGGAAVGTTFWLKVDNPNATYQLMMNETTSSLDVPVVDHVVALGFEYYAEPQPPRMTRPLADPTGPWTTYGPAPGVVPNPPFGAGENCVFFSDGTPEPQPRLADLGPVGGALVALTRSELSDGPWCPNDAAADRWDADLLRVRAVSVAIRVQAALAVLRGPASVLFAHGGTSTGGDRWVPDAEIRFQVTPRNLNVGR